MMGPQAAVLLPVRLETRFDPIEDGRVTRLRVLVVPDGCWFDRHQPASADELALLERAIEDAAGALLTGDQPTPEAGAAFRALADKVGAGRALWLAREAAGQAGDEPRTGAAGTRIHGLPPELQLYADVADANGIERRVLLDRHPVARRAFTITPSADEADGWWPSWDNLEAAGLTFDARLEDDQGPIDPNTITALYVVGLGDTPAEDVLRPHLAAGDLGLAQQGSPTNTVAGAPAAELGRDPAAWLALASRGTFPEEQRVGHALTGDPEGLGPLVGASDGLADELAQVLVPLLWPALVGTALNDAWWTPPDGLDPVERRAHWAAVAARTGDLREWATRWLRPDGPLPILRIGDQPYGLWPVTEWSRWVGSDWHVPVVRTLLPSVAERARSGLGTAVEADAERLWELLAQTPTSNEYEVRGALPIRWLRDFLDPGSQATLDDWWRRILDVLAGVLPGEVVPQGDAGAHVMTLGAPVPLALRLVLPDSSADPRETLRPAFEVGEDEALDLLENRPAEWIAAACRGFRDLFREERLNGDLWGNMTDPIEWWPPSLLWRLIVVSGLVALDHAVREANEDYRDEGSLIERVDGGIPSIHHGAAVEGYWRFLAALKHLEDLCADSNRADVPAVLDRVLRGLLDTATVRIDPWLTGSAWSRLEETGESRPVGLYGWVDRPHTGAPGPDFATGVLLAPSDRQARTAVILRDKNRSDPDGKWQLNLSSSTVRDAARLGEDVRAGAHPAEALGREVERLVGDRPRIDRLRRTFPLRTEHAGRRTCDGLKVFDAARANASDPRLVDAGLTPADIERITGLGSTLDAYGDLLVADAVHHALAGRPEAAHQSMEAAAGLGMPPQLDVLATPRPGRAVHTTVVARLPAATARSTERSPAAIASPAFAAWLAAATGEPTTAAWTWTVDLDAGATEVRLADLGFVPADALGVHPHVLDALVLDSLESGGPSVAVEIGAPAGPGNVRQHAAAMAARAPTGADFGASPELATAIDGGILADLRSRLTRLDAAAAQAIAQLDAATSDAERSAALREAARWGIVPTFDADELEERVGAAADALRDRRDTIASLDPATDVQTLARTVAQVAVGDAQLPMFVPTGGTGLAAAVGDLTAEPLDGDGRPRLDASWLEVVAAVRPPLARIEAHQARAVMAGVAPLHAATSHPADPWLVNVPAPKPSEEDPRLIVAYGPPAGGGAGDVAIGILDAWAEVIPGAESTAAAAFRFNAPGSRAPQALLLAVAPVSGEELSPETIAAIVGDARLAAHARMARREDLAHLDLLGGGLLPAFERGGFQRAVPATWRDWPS